jgi:hypothetical protein
MPKTLEQFLNKYYKRYAYKTEEMVEGENGFEIKVGFGITMIAHRGQCEFETKIKDKYPNVSSVMCIDYINGPAKDVVLHYRYKNDYFMLLLVELVGENLSYNICLCIDDGGEWEPVYHIDQDAIDIAFKLADEIKPYLEEQIEKEPSKRLLLLLEGVMYHHNHIRGERYV